MGSSQVLVEQQRLPRSTAAFGAGGAMGLAMGQASLGWPGLVLSPCAVGRSHIPAISTAAPGTQSVQG